MAWEYSEKTKQLFMDAVHGKPGTHLGEIEDPDGVGETEIRECLGGAPTSPPIVQAVDRGHLEIVRLLLKAGKKSLI